ncbi:hypothetical protein [Nocardia sp. NPDC049149]|uniref:hypothetical protein n=1 Tax=Nocardia sp. NPDC049149 TaxID=3364315 RepID=UPI00371EF9A2
MDEKSPQPRADYNATRIVYLIAAGIGLLAIMFAPFTLMFAASCTEHTCREGLGLWSLGLTVGGVAVTLLVAGMKIGSARRRGQSQFKWALIAVVGVFASSCGGLAVMKVAVTPHRPDVSRQAGEVQAGLGQLPGVQRASVGAAHEVFASVVLAVDATPDQTKTVVQSFRNETNRPEFRQREFVIELRNNSGTSTFTSWSPNLDTAPDLVQRWFAMQHAFADGEVKWDHRLRDTGRTDNVLGDISVQLQTAADHTAITEAYRRVAQDFPDLSTAWWKISAKSDRVGSLSSVGRYPNELEISVWNRLNADQEPSRVVRMAPRSVSEKLKSPDLKDAESLAQKHLPIVAELGIPIEYVAGSDIIGAGPTGRPVTVTVGGCTKRRYPPNPVEQALADQYEKC